ncbi:MAG: dienelactone hydrolase family protein [Acidobacteriota bacterium]
MIIRNHFTDLTTPTGIMRTHVYEPVSAERTFPGLLLYSEIFQQTAPIARLCAQFASHGYVVMAPEIYHQHEAPGTVLGYDDVGKEKGNAYKKQTRLATFDEDAGVVLGALREHPQCNGRLGVAGFCIGGHLAFRAALHPEIRACLSFYPTDLHSGTIGEGGHADTLARAAEIKGEVALLWGRQDPHIPAEGRATVYRALLEAGTQFTWHEVNAEHAFMRDEGARYDAEAARLAMTIALGVLQRTL